MKKILASHLDFDPNSGRIILDEAPFTGISYEEYPSGELWNISVYLDGFRTGLSITFYPSEIIKQEQYFLYGAFHGTIREWSEDSILVKEGFYVLGVKITEKVWDTEGELISEYKIQEDSFNLKLLKKEGFELPLHSF